MPLRLVAVCFDAHDPAGLGAFWARLLGREIVEESTGALLPGDDTQVGLRFSAATTTKSGVNRTHLHLTSTDVEQQRHTIEIAVALGGRHVDVGQRPEEGHIVLTDTEGNEFCVIEPDSNFLAGCGFLGEVACEGNRQVGLFWRDALDWPLVWDHDEETAIQSPHGGTKIAWGGPPVAPKRGRNRQRLELAAPEVAAEVQRLVALGATELGQRDGGIELADPDGNELLLTPG